MITIIQPKSPLELNLELINQPLILVENYAKAIAHNLNRAMDIFWGLSDSEILELMNHKGPVEMNEIFTAHAKNAGYVNSLLADRGIEAMAIIGMRKPVEFSMETGRFFMNYPPAPEPEVEVVSDVVEEPIIEPEIS